MAAIIFKQSFKYEWNVNTDGNGFDFFDYMCNPEKFKPELHSDENDLYYDYMDYMKNSEKSNGAFDSEHDVLNVNQINEYRKLEIQSQQKGCPKYLGVISFENDFLKENGIMNSYGEIDHDRLKSYARQSINALVDKSQKLKSENVYWTAAIHENTDNIHIHYQMLEYERLEDRKNKYRDKDMIETKAFEALKSKMVNLIAPQKERKELIDKLEKEIIRPNLQASFTNTDGRIFDLYKKISEYDKPRKWQYGSYTKTDKHKEDPMKKEIDSVVRNIIQSNETLSKRYTDFEKQLNDYDDYAVYLYGKRSDIPKAEQIYSYNKRNDFYNRAGNALLSYMRELDLSDFKLDKTQAQPEPYLSGEEIEDFTSLEPTQVLPDKPPYIDAIAEPDLDFEKSLLPDGETPYLSGEEITNFNGLKEYMLGARYLDNEQNDIDLDKAEKYLLLSAEKGNQYAQYRLGKLYLSEEKKNYDNAEKYLLLASSQGGKFSQWADFKLGKLYMINEKLDYVKAEKHFLLSDRYENPYAECSLGLLICKTRSKSEGKAWVQKAAENGNEFAQEILPKLDKPCRPRRRYNKAKSNYVNYKINGMIRRLQSEYERHIKQLQNEYEYETERAEAEKEYEYDYIDTNEITR